MKKKILKELSKVTGDGLEGDIVSLGLVSEIIINDDKVVFSITVPEDFSGDISAIREDAEAKVAALEGIENVLVALTSQRPEEAASPAPAPKRDQSKPVGPDMRPQAGAIPGVHSIIAVASGKGGVGKSTTAVNLALGLRSLGLKVGILDADIYGPSIPRLLAIFERPAVSSEQRIIPFDKYGLKVMSMGFMMDEEAPVIWRGPMVSSALMQLVREVDWGELDVLVLDMPPGTGDAQLTMAQQVPLSGAVIVSTPQDLALVDARKGLKMFKQVDVPIMGIVENMSIFVCPHCGEDTDIFGHGGAREEAEKLKVTFLGAVPLHKDIRVNSDAGTPVVVSEPDSAHTKIYQAIALKLAAQLAPEE